MTIWAICKNGLLPNSPKWANSENFGPIPWQAAEIIGGLLATEWQSDRVTESQTPKGTQYTGGWNFFLPDFNKLPYLLFSQGGYIFKVESFIQYYHD